MPRRPSPKSKRAPAARKRKADPKQFARFVEAAKKIGVDESPEALDRAFDKIAPSATPKGKSRGDS